MSRRLCYVVAMSRSSDTTTVRLTRGTVERMRELARIHDRPLSWEIERALHAYMAQAALDEDLQSMDAKLSRMFPVETVDE